MSMTEAQTGVLLIDDDVFARKGLRAVIESEPALAVVGEAGDCEEALTLASEAGARVIIAEAVLADQGCLRLLQGVRSVAPEVAVIVLERYSRGEEVLPLLQAGAAGYLCKSVPPDELISAVLTVAAGRHVLEPKALEAVLRDYATRGSPVASSSAHPLTRRERQVLTLVAEGRSTREIAAELSLSQKTVEVHRSRLMKKLRLHKVADLVRYAVREGLVAVD
jgi:DNA-binding NarL/FixJ family response regulator